MKKLLFAAVMACTAVAAQAKDIVATAVSAGDFKTLAAALGAAELVQTLKGRGPFTVFAPTDEAFAKIAKAGLDALLKDKAKLKAVLTYHVDGQGDDGAGQRRHRQHDGRRDGEQRQGRERRCGRRQRRHPCDRYGVDAQVSQRGAVGANLVSERAARCLRSLGASEGGRWS